MRVVQYLAALWLLSGAGVVQAQNVLRNGGFEDFPTAGMGDHTSGIPITPWVVVGTWSPNVVAVDGSGAYGNSGPALDADPATGAGVIQHYLDITSSAGTLYQVMNVPACAQSGQYRAYDYSAAFSGRDGGNGAGTVQLRSGVGAAGAVLAATSVTANGAVSWTPASGSVFLPAGAAVSFVITMSDPTNVDQAILSPRDDQCHFPGTLSLEKEWVGAAVNDQATLTATRSGSSIVSRTVQAAAVNQIVLDPSPVTVLPNDQITLAETLAPSNQAPYQASLNCTGGGSLVGNVLTVNISGQPITCRYRNVSNRVDLVVTKTNTPAQGANDQPADTLVAGPTVYRLVVANNGPAAANGARLLDQPAAPLSCSSVACVGTTGGAACPVAAQLTIGNLTTAPGIALTLPAGSSLSFDVTCAVP